MNTTVRWLSACVALVLASFAIAWAQNEPAAPAGGGGDLDAEAMLQIWERMNAPGKNHEMLARFAGEWDAQCTFWLTPNAEPMTGKGTLKGEAIYEGRFIRSIFEGTGFHKDKPLGGTSYLGYNTITKKFETFWIGSSTTGMMLATGDASADGKTITLTSTFDDPLTGGKASAKYVYQWAADDKFVFTMFRTVGEKDVKEGEIAYTRKK